MTREDLIYKANNYTYNFRQFRTIGFFGRDAYIRKINIEEANELHSAMLMEIINFNKQKKSDKKEQKRYCSKRIRTF